MTNDKKTVSVVVPIYNEVEMINEIFFRVDSVFEKIADYNYELVFFDDGSFDGTTDAVKRLCSEHKEVKAVFYSKNFGYLKNTFYSMQQAKGDCAILLHADLQNPPELIPEFIKKWEQGAQVVLGVKNKSKENKLMFFLRTVCYFIIIHFFGVKITAHATEFELFDKSFVEVLKRINVPKPFLRGIVSEYATKKDYVYYTQDARKKGKSKFNFKKYYDFAMCGIVQYSSNIPRKCIICSVVGILAAIIETSLFVLLKSPNMPAYDFYNSILLRAIIFILLFFLVIISLLSEYIIFYVQNNGEKPFVIEEGRLDY